MGRQKLGQHFLVSGDKAQRIVELGQIAPSDFIVEIGPGRGVLTERLLAKGKALAAIELDRCLADGLMKKYRDIPGFRVFSEDAARFDYTCFPAPFKVVSNLPYCAASAILLRLLEFKERISLMVLMFQLEVAQRITAPPGGRSYNPLSILVQYHAAASLKFIVPKENFSPRPKVESAVVTLIPHRTPPCMVKNEAFFFALVKQAFSQKRKKLANNLKTLAGSSSALKDAGIDPGARAETVPMDAFAALSNILCQ